ncbi:MAG: cation transporter [Gallionella sp.]|nr:cation transporter [Gallionella sp.]
MADCCNDKACEIDALRSRQSSTLKIVLGVNAVMFIVELTAGLIGNSVSLVADSLDMLGDALVYGFSLYVVARSSTMKARVALLKGAVMAAFGLFVLGQAIYRIVFPQLPVFEMIGAIGLLALAANSLCFYLLWRHRADDINMNSVWLCSRNDIIANISVLFAAAGVWLTHSGWPDILVGLALAALFLHSAWLVLRTATTALRTHQP